MTPAAFYCVADSRYFLGAVAMINSLRLHGHSEPIYVADAGLEPWQRELLAPEVTIVGPPDQTAPHLLKTAAPLAHPAETAVLIDADMIVCRPLSELIERAAAGRVVAFANNMDRFVPQWGERTGLGAVRRGPYVSSGFVAAGGAVGRSVIALMHGLRDRVDYDRTLWRANDEGYAFLYADQDLLNAIVHTRVAADDLVVLDSGLAPTQPFAGVDLAGDGSLRAIGPGGTEPYLLHHVLPGKPWLRAGHASPYSELLGRALAPGHAIEVDPALVPPWLRRGRRARLRQRMIDAREQLRWHAPSLPGRRSGTR